MKTKITRTGKLKVKKEDHWIDVNCFKDWHANYASVSYYGAFLIANGTNGNTGNFEYCLINLITDEIIDTGDQILFFGHFVVDKPNGDCVRYNYNPPTLTNQNDKESSLRSTRLNEAQPKREQCLENENRDELLLNKLYEQDKLLEKAKKDHNVFALEIEKAAGIKGIKATEDLNIYVDDEGGKFLIVSELDAQQKCFDLLRDLYMNDVYQKTTGVLGDLIDPQCWIDEQINCNGRGYYLADDGEENIFYLEGLGVACCIYKQS